MTLYTTAASVPLVITRRGASATPPEVTAQVTNLRDILYRSVQGDYASGVRICPMLWATGPLSKETQAEYQARINTFYPFGKDAECRARYVRQPGPFRQGVYSVFQQFKNGKRKDLADALVEPLVAMIATDASIPTTEARAVVGQEYQRNFGTYPLVPGVPTGPLHVEPSGQKVQVGPVDMPGIPEDFYVAGEEIETAPAPSGEFPWLLVGAGVLVLAGGGYYLMTRKR